MRRSGLPIFAELARCLEASQSPRLQLAVAAAALQPGTRSTRNYTAEHLARCDSFRNDPCRCTTRSYSEGSSVEDTSSSTSRPRASSNGNIEHAQANNHEIPTSGDQQHVPDHYERLMRGSETVSRGGIDRPGSLPSLGEDLSNRLKAITLEADQKREMEEAIQERDRQAVLTMTNEGQMQERVPCTWNDIGTNAQLEWYQLATSEPLIHEKTNTLIFVHSVHSWHHASLETTMALMGLHTPTVLTVQCDNTVRGRADQLIAEVNVLTNNGEDLRRIADAYIRKVTRNEDDSELNTTPQEIEQNYQKGRKIARIFGITDVQNLLEDVRDTHPDQYEAIREQLEDDDGVDTRWELMYLTGLLPDQEFHDPYQNAKRRGVAVEFIDMPMASAEEAYQSMYLHLESDDAMKAAMTTDSEKGEEILSQFGQQHLPAGVAPHLISRIATAVATPTKTAELLEQFRRQSPRLYNLEKHRADYVAQALLQICEGHSAIAARKQRVVVCLVARWIEPLVRAQWLRIKDGGEGDSEIVLKSSAPHRGKKSRSKKSSRY